MREQDRSGPIANSGQAQRSPIEWMRWVPAVLLAILFLIVVFISGRIILVPLLASLALAYLLAPVVSWFEGRGWSRPSSVLLSLIAVSVALILILIFILPSFWKQLIQSYYLAQSLLNNQSLLQSVLNKIKQVSIPLHDYLKSQIDQADWVRIGGLLGAWLQGGLFQLVNLTTSLLDLLLIPFFVYYLLADYAAMRARVDRLIPPRYREVTTKLIGQVNEVLSSYVTSQLRIALAMGLLYSAGFLALRVPLAITIGMLSGLLNFVPYLGTLTGLALSLLFAALDGAGIGRLIGVVTVFIIVQSLEGYYLTPKLLGSRLHLHPLWVLAGLVIGGNLFGLAGIILAVPVIAIAKVVIRFLEEQYQQTDFYRSAGLDLLTDQGQPVKLLTPTDSPALIVEGSQPPSSRRTIITTGELKSRIPKTKSPEDQVDQ